MKDDLPFPDPRKYGTTPEDLERLGKALLRYLRSNWADLSSFQQSILEAKLRLKPVPSGISVYFDAAIKNALAGKLRLAGKHYRSWLNHGYAEDKGLDVSRAVRRHVSVSRATQNKQENKNRKFLLVVEEALRVLDGRTRPIATDPLAIEVSKRIKKKTGEAIPKETVRRYLKWLPAFKRRSTKS